MLQGVEVHNSRGKSPGGKRRLERRGGGGRPAGHNDGVASVAKPRVQQAPAARLVVVVEASVRLALQCVTRAVGCLQLDLCRGCRRAAELDVRRERFTQKLMPGVGDLAVARGFAENDDGGGLRLNPAGASEQKESRNETATAET